MLKQQLSTFEELVDVRQPADGVVELHLRGEWLTRCFDQVKALTKVLTDHGTDSGVVVIAGEVARWDTALVWFIQSLSDRGEQVQFQEIPAGVESLLELAKVPADDEVTQDGVESRAWLRLVRFFESLGQKEERFATAVRAHLSFLGELCIALVRLLTGRGRFRLVDVLEQVSSHGPGGFWIVSLIATLVGLILAFISAVQLEKFGAQLYVANLISLAMFREMGSLMAAVIVAGRSGAAFAAQLGTMVGNDEVDALRTVAVDPIDFLVMPRVLALVLMMPALAMYANVMGIFGGGLVAVLLFDLSFLEFLQQARSVTGISDVAVGLVKSVVFGFLVAYAGCFHGYSCGRNARAVGEAATSAVVVAIVLLVLTDAFFAVVFHLIGL